MKYIATLAVLMALALPAAAAQQVVLAKTSSEQRAVTEIVSARIRAALDGEPYMLDKPCEQDCTVSSRAGN
jgi:hypothetical protein